MVGTINLVIHNVDKRDLVRKKEVLDYDCALIALVISKQHHFSKEDEVTEIP